MSLRKLHPYQIVGGFVLLFVCIALVMPPNPVTIERYHFSAASFRIVLLSAAIIPAILTWLAACYGYVQLRRYADTIAKTTEGPAFCRISRGVKWLAFGLPIVSTLSLTLTAIANAHEVFRGTAIITINYATIVLALVATTAMSNGARLLADTTGARPFLWLIRLASLLFILVGVLYCFSLVSHSVSWPNPYHLPMGLLLLTVVVPFLYAWFIGLLAALDIHAYSTTVEGLLFGKSLREFSGGVILIVSSSILMQFINTANTERGRLLLGSTFLLRYLAYLTMIGGFAIIAKSAKKLQQMEKI